MSNPEYSSNNELNLREGTWTYPVDLSARDVFDDQTLLPETELRAKLDQIFQAINTQGGDYKGIITLDVSGAPRGGIVGTITEKAWYLVIKK